MTFGDIVAMFGVMLVLAATPGTSVLIVVSRSAASGFVHGMCVALGIVIGDIIFILIAISGMSLLAGSMADLFVLVKYLGSGYLIWLGASLWRSKPIEIKTDENVETSLLASFMSGLLFTLSDLKAILFYLGFFPAFVDLASMTLTDTVMIVLLAFVAVGGVKAAYACMASRAASLFSCRARLGVNMIAGSLMICIALFAVITA